MGLPILGGGAAANAVAARPLPTVRALEALWQEVASRPLWAPPRLWRYLRLRARMRLRFVDAARTSLVTPVGQVNDCGACSDSCCVGTRSTVLLRLRDIATLVDLGRTELMVAQKPQFSAAQLQASPALRRQTRSDAWRIFPVLAQNGYDACMALTDEGRCSLYPHWPLSCARFPLSLHLQAAEVFYSRRCRSFWIHPDQASAAQPMRLAAVASYNERIKDAVLLAYAPDRLHALGLMAYLEL